MRSVLVFLVVLFGLVEAARADDAGTLTVDGKAYRLDGIDAPEIDQTCLDEEGEAYPCGQRAAKAVEAFIADRTVTCDDLGPDAKYPKRRIGLCRVDGVDLQSWLVWHGWALNFEPSARARFVEEERSARERGRGMWKGCFVAPQDFRRWHKYAPLLGAACPIDARTAVFPSHPQMPQGCEIKGRYAVRAALTGHVGIYHVPGCGSYRRTARVDRWFCSEEDAMAAGFRGSFTCGLK
jgi:endonuclease YncB( thermonuclease family)